MDKTEASSFIEKHRKHDKDTGSIEVQVALLTRRISDLTEHLRAHHLDHSTRRGLMKLVGQRRRLLKYLNRSDIGSYNGIVKSLGLRK